MHAIRPLRLLSVLGTRPEAIKMAPVALAAAGDARFQHRILATGQHDQLFDEAMADFGLSADARLAWSKTGALEGDCTAMLAALGPVLAAEAPDMVLVQGDTSSACCAARAAAALELPVGHVEAGLRSGHPTLPFPEEGNRTEIDRLAALLFAPSPQAMANLRADPLVTGTAVLTGNSGIDALCRFAPIASPLLHEQRRQVLVTIHRRENIARLPAICAALRALAARGDVELLLPLHRNPLVSGTLHSELAGVDSIRLIAPLHYPQMIAAMRASLLVLSDSGGVQEEAPALGVPLLVLRDQTERSEPIASGNAWLIGTDPTRIIAEVERLLDDPAALAGMSRPCFPYGTGDAAPRILEAIAQHLRPALGPASEAVVAFRPFPAQQVALIQA